MAGAAAGAGATGSAGARAVQRLAPWLNRGASLLVHAGTSATHHHHHHFSPALSLVLGAARPRIPPRPWSTAGLHLPSPPSDGGAHVTTTTTAATATTPAICLAPLSAHACRGRSRHRHWPSCHDHTIHHIGTHLGPTAWHVLSAHVPGVVPHPPAGDIAERGSLIMQPLLQPPRHYQPQRRRMHQPQPPWRLLPARSSSSNRRWQWRLGGRRGMCSSGRRGRRSRRCRPPQYQIRRHGLIRVLGDVCAQRCDVGPAAVRI